MSSLRSWSQFPMTPRPLPAHIWVPGPSCSKSLWYPVRSCTPAPIFFFFFFGKGRGSHFLHHRLIWHLRPLGQELFTTPVPPPPTSHSHTLGPYSGDFKLGPASHPAPAQPYKGIYLPLTLASGQTWSNLSSEPHSSQSFVGTLAFLNLLGPAAFL